MKDDGNDSDQSTDAPLLTGTMDALSMTPSRDDIEKRSKVGRAKPHAKTVGRKKENKVGQKDQINRSTGGGSKLYGVALLVLIGSVGYLVLQLQNTTAVLGEQSLLLKEYESKLSSIDQGISQTGAEATASEAKIYEMIAQIESKVLQVENAGKAIASELPQLREQIESQDARFEAQDVRAEAQATKLKGQEDRVQLQSDLLGVIAGVVGVNDGEAPNFNLEQLQERFVVMDSALSKTAFNIDSLKNQSLIDQRVLGEIQDRHERLDGRVSAHQARLDDIDQQTQSMDMAEQLVQMDERLSELSGELQQRVSEFEQGQRSMNIYRRQLNTTIDQLVEDVRYLKQPPDRPDQVSGSR